MDRIISPREAAMFEVLKGHTGNCQRRTCLKWGGNGELSALDCWNLMQLIANWTKKPVYGRSASTLTQEWRENFEAID